MTDLVGAMPSHDMATCWWAKQYAISSTLQRAHGHGRLHQNCEKGAAARGPLDPTMNTARTQTALSHPQLKKGDIFAASDVDFTYNKCIIYIPPRSLLLGSKLKGDYLHHALLFAGNLGNNVDRNLTFDIGRISSSSSSLGSRSVPWLGECLSIPSPG